MSAPVTGKALSTGSLQFSVVRAWQHLSGGQRLLADLIFPPHCLVCGVPLYGSRPGLSLCEACLAEIRPANPRCARCAMPLPAAVQTIPTHAPSSHFRGNRCPHCRRQPLHLRSVVAVGQYTGRLQEIVLRMKKASQEQLTLSMGSLLAECLLASPSFVTDRHPNSLLREESACGRASQMASSPPIWVAPVPMHWSRRWRRGVNQASLLAEAVARSLGVPLRPNLLQCVRKIKKQGTLSPQERRRNVRDAFRVSASYAIQGRHVLLVDDVLTTGATANELARLLKRAGAASIRLAVVARATGT